MATISRYQTSSGATLYRVRYRTPEGRQTDKRGFRTKREADAYAAELEVSKLRGEYIAPSLGAATVGKLGPAWLARQQGHMRPSGWRSYESAWRLHVAPRWESVRISDIRFSDVQAWVSTLATTHGATTVQRSYSILAQTLDDAVRDRMLAASPARGVRLPKRPPQRHAYLTAAQLRHLSDESGSYRGLVLLLGLGGLRWGEAAALRVSDVDWARCRISLTRNAVMVGGRVQMGPLKTHENRAVVVPRVVIEALSVAMIGKGRDDLLWSTGTGEPMGPPCVGANGTSWLAYAVRRCQDADPSFPAITAHALRHTAASLAVSAGANVKAVARMLGHAKASMTLDTYADLFESDLDAVAENVGMMWARASSSV
jgi:integrase